MGKKRHRGFRLTIGAKLVGLVALLLIGAVVSLVWIATRLFIQDNTALIQQINADTATSLATRMREHFEAVTEKMRVLGTLEISAEKDTSLRDRVAREFFSKDKEFLALFVHEMTDATDGKVKASALSPELAKTGDEKGEKTLQILSGLKEFSLAQLAKGEVQVTSARLSDNSPAVIIGVPFIQKEFTSDRFSHLLTAVIRQNRFLRAFGDSDVVTSFVTDRRGNLLAHSDSSLASSGENVSHLEIVKQLLEGKFNNGQTRYLEPKAKVPMLAAFRVVGFGGLGVVAEVPEAKAFEAAKRVEYRSMLVALIILSVAFLAGYLYSGSITWPIKQLVVASERVASGDFKIKLTPKTRDEIADLSLAFNDMAMGLEERDRVKATFSKFHSKEIAEKLLSGEVKLGGEKKRAVIFFSDIRGFTALAESIAPEQVVEMLNEYMTQMVSVIRKYGGVVDKYVGDAIMAIWGVPIEGQNDERNAIRACLAMRVELAKLNQVRLSRNQPALYMGMGVNQGDVIAGNIGSDEKMEYTVIGDSVNLASRIESMTKELGTDLLVSESLAASVKDEFQFEPCGTMRVKGKAQTVSVLRVLGYRSDKGEMVKVETPYSRYAAEPSDKVVRDQKKAA